MIEYLTCATFRDFCSAFLAREECLAAGCTVRQLQSDLAAGGTHSDRWHHQVLQSELCDQHEAVADFFDEQVD